MRGKENGNLALQSWRHFCDTSLSNLQFFYVCGYIQCLSAQLVIFRTKENVNSMSRDIRNLSNFMFLFKLLRIAFFTNKCIEKIWFEPCFTFVDKICLKTDKVRYFWFYLIMKNLMSQSYYIVSSCIFLKYWRNYRFLLDNKCSS